MRVFGLVTPDRAAGGTSPRFCFLEMSRWRPSTPRGGAPACDSPSSPREAARDTPSADPSGCGRLRSHEAAPQLGVLDIDNLVGMPMGTAVSAHHLAGEPLRNPENGAQGFPNPEATFRAQKFPSAISLRIAFSSSASAKSFLRRAFSFTSWVNRLASSACMPPYCCFQRW
jgi:hypothetical protein